MKRIEKLRHMAELMDRMNQNSLNFFNETLEMIDTLYVRMCAEEAYPPQLRGYE